MAYKVWFTQTTEWYVEIPDAATPEEAEDLVYLGDESVWEFKDFCGSEVHVTDLEEM